MIFNVVPGLPNIDFRITQGFGERPEEYAPYKGHYGYDIAAIKPGQKQVIYSPHEGYAKLVKSDKGFGWHIILTSLPNTKNEEGFYSLIGHMSEFYVLKSGHYVPANEPIGVSGKTGWASGVHIHWLFGRCDKNGNLKNKNNGYMGAEDQGPHTRLWHPNPMGILTPDLPKSSQPLLSYETSACCCRPQ